MTDLNKIAQLHKWPLNEILEDKLTDYYMLDKNTPLFFKISDSKDLVRFVQKNLKTQNDISHFFGEKTNELQKMKASKMWLRLEDESIITMNLLDIYETFIKSLKDETFEDYLFNAYDVSFVGLNGPFKTMSFINILKEDVIQNIIFYSVMKNKLPTRKFRVHTKGRVLFRFGENLGQEDFFEVRQISDSGILFSSQNTELLQNMSTGDSLKVFISSQRVQKFTENKLQSSDEYEKDLFYTEDELSSFEISESKTVKSLSHRSGENNEFFLFMKFKDMKRTEIPHVFKNFLDKAQKHIKNFVA